MNVLVVSPHMPWPLISGSKIHLFHDIKYISKDNQVDIVCNVKKDMEKEGLSEIKEMCGEVYTNKMKSKNKYESVVKSIFSNDTYRSIKFESKGMSKTISSALKRKEYDLVWFHYLNTFNYIDLNSLGDEFVIFDQHNADELVWSGYLNEEWKILRPLFRNEIRKVRSLRKKVLEYVDVVLSVSQREKLFMEKVVPKDTSVILEPNGVNIEYFNPKNKYLNEKVDSKVVLFCGSMDKRRNTKAVKYFYDEIFPKILRGVENVMFYIVGRKPSKKVRNLGSDEKVKVTGAVDDVRPYYEMASVSVIPFRHGGGAKLKVFESMAMKTPVVSTPVGSQGVDARDGHEICIEETPIAFAKRVIDILDCSNRYSTLRKNAKKLVVDKYSWMSIMDNTMSEIKKRVK